MSYQCRHPKGPYVACSGHREFIRFKVFQGHPIQGTFQIPFDGQAKRCFSKAGGTKVSKERMSTIRDQNVGLL